MSKTIDFERPGGREWFRSGTLFDFFCIFFGSVFGPARVQISSTSVLRSVFFLQRQKKVFKSSYRVRGMGPPPGIHFCMCCYHNQQNKKTKTKKNGAKLFYCDNSIFFAFSQRAPNCSIVVTVLNKTCVFFGLCFFVLLIVEAAHAKADPWGGPIPRTLQELLNTFFWRCKKSHFWAQVCWISVHARVRKHIQKNCKKTRSGVPSERRTPRQD